MNLTDAIHIVVTRNESDQITQNNLGKMNDHDFVLLKEKLIIVSFFSQGNSHLDFDPVEVRFDFSVSPG